ncbi:MAG: bacteriohemerythrin [Pseudomonadota bacterium]
METFQWKKEFDVGNEEINDQHKKWFEILNDTHNKMLGNIKSDISKIGPDALKKVIDYTKYHFSFEEKHMLKIGFSDIDRHKKLHEKFIKKVDQIALDLHRGELVLNSEIIKVIKNWLIEHILKEDQKFCGFGQKNLIDFETRH